MEKIIEQHENMIDKHEDKLEHIQSDITDIKVRLGIKDKTNGQVVAYQKQLMEHQQLEIQDRKDADALLREDIRSLDDKLWYIVVGIAIVIFTDVLVLLGGVIIG